MTTQREDETLAYLADTHFNGSYFNVLVQAWEFSNGKAADKFDQSQIEIELMEYLHGGDLPVYARHYLRQRGASVLPA